MQEFSFEVTSVPDREQLVAELWFGADQVAELSPEDNATTIRLFSPPGGEWEFPFEEFRRALEELRSRLVRRP